MGRESRYRAQQAQTMRAMKTAAAKDPTITPVKAEGELLREAQLRSFAEVVALQEAAIRLFDARGALDAPGARNALESVRSAIIELGRMSDDDMATWIATLPEARG